MASPFTPTSELECHEEPQTALNTTFGDNAQPAPHPFPPILATVTQLNRNMPQQGQKRNFWDLDDVDNSMLVQQHHDPAFYGLSASLPMSTYATPSSPNTQKANKRYKLSNQNAQRGYPSMQAPPQACISSTSWSVASARSKAVYNNHSMSRHGIGVTELHKPMQLPQQINSGTCVGSSLSTDSYMLDPPPSWNWINQLHHSGAAINVQQPYDNNFAFMWPVLNDEPPTLPHPPCLYQGPIEMQQTLIPSYAPMSATTTDVSCSTPESPREFHTLQATPEASNNYFSYVGAQVDENRPTDGSLGRQDTQISMASQRKPLQGPEGNKSNELYRGIASIAETSQPDLSPSFTFTASMFENMPNLDHDFGFDCGLDGEIQVDGDTPSNTNEMPQDQGKVTLSQHVDRGSTTDSYDESAMATLLQPVASYLSSSGPASAQEAANDLTSNGMSVSDGAAPGKKHYEASPTTRNKSSSSIIESQLIECVCSATTEAELTLQENYMPSNPPLQRNTRNESTISNIGPSMTSAINSGISSGTQAAVPTKPDLVLSPGGRHDVQEWVNRQCSGDYGQLVAARLKVPMVGKEGGTYGQQLTWENECSEVDADQPKNLSPCQKDLLQSIMERLAKSQKQRLPLDKGLVKWTDT